MSHLQRETTSQNLYKVSNLQRRLSCPAAYGTLVPGTGIEPTSPALAGGFLTTAPPGKSLLEVLNLGMLLGSNQVGKK